MWHMPDARYPTCRQMFGCRLGTRHICSYNNANVVDRTNHSYIMGGGLCNQQLGQITGLLLGRHLQADTIYVPPPYFRDSFSKVFENTTWTLLEHSALWDMAKMKELLHKQNQTLVENKLISHNIVTERGAAVPEHATELQVRANACSSSPLATVTHRSSTCRRYSKADMTLPHG